MEKYCWAAMSLEKMFLAMLQMIPGIGNVRLRKLVSYFGNGETIWKSSVQDVWQSKCLDRGSFENFCEFRKNPIDIDLLAEKWRKKKIKLCTYLDAEYPELLKNIFNPPSVLFYRGVLSGVKQRVAIVGSRKTSAYGKAAAENLAGDLAEAGIEIVSGAARGIDTSAHLGALKKGRTIAVLGCGVDIVYPIENKSLLENIVESGLVVSEYPPGTTPNAKFFPARNRIISGLSSGVIVVEAALKSGSLITAEMALSEGRDVFAVPGSIYSEQSKGCHKLIQQGAKLVSCAKDVLEEYSWNESECNINKNVINLSNEEKAVYENLSYDQPLSIDEIILKSRSDASNITCILLQMELRGLVVEHAPHCYVRAVKEGVL